MDEAGRTTFSRRTFLLSTAIGAAALLLPACRSEEVELSERTISFGFEDIVTRDPRWDYYRQGMDRSGVNAVNLSIGRVDWTAFPWDEHPEAASSLVSETGRDYLRESIEQINGSADDKRIVTITIDALVPGLIARDPSVAGVDAWGEPNSDFASVTALSTGRVGDLIVELAAEACERYAPDRIALTELMFDDSTFGDEDLESYRTFTGRDDWPREPDGSIDIGHITLGEWRSDALARLMARVKAKAEPRNVATDIDVRASWDDPNGDRPMSGHDYEILLASVDRIIVWNYFELTSRPAEYGAEIARALKERFPGRFLMSTGLWGTDSTLEPDRLLVGLDALTDAGAAAVGVTPASLMTDGHWEAVREAWSSQ